MDFLSEKLQSKKFQIPEKLKSFNIKQYEASDYEKLLTLYDIFYPDLGLEEKLLWQNEKSPFRTKDSFTFLMEDKDNIIAQYLVAPKQFYIYGKKILCVLSMGTMTHPDYSGQGISTYLARLTYEYSRINGYKYVYGFPNPNSIYMFEKKLGWTNFGKILMYAKNISSKINQPKINNYNIEEIEIFNKDVNELWEKEKFSIPITIEKSRDYLNWRFSNHPLFKYKNFQVYNKLGEIQAYFVLKKYEDKNKLKYGHLVDFLIDSSDKTIENDVFKYIEEFAIDYFKNECSKFSTWFPKKKYTEYALKNMNYKASEMDTYFGYKLFELDKNLNILTKKENWYNTMANNDAF